MKKKSCMQSGSLVVDASTGQPVRQIEMANGSNCNHLWVFARLLGARQRYDPSCLPLYKKVYSQSIDEAMKRLDVTTI
jgi:hypothetical protein